MKFTDFDEISSQKRNICKKTRWWWRRCSEMKSRKTFKNTFYRN